MTCSESPLPQEILELIVSCISHDIASLRRILQVCRAFAPVARKYLYREITLLDDKNPEEVRPQTPPIFTDASFIALLKGLPFIGHLVKAVRICGSTRCIDTKQTIYMTSKHLHLILPHLSSLESISFHRTRSGPWTPHSGVRVQQCEVTYMLMTAQIAKVIPPCVQSVWLSQVKFENDAAVDIFFSTCRHLTHLGLDKVSVLYKQRSLSGRITSAARIVWRRVFPTTPSLPPAHAEPIALRSYAHGSFVFLPRLPFTDSEKAPYFELTSVTKLKLYSPLNSYPLLGYWDTLVRHTASSVQELMIVTALCRQNANLNALPDPPSSVWNLAGHTCLRSLVIVLYDMTILPENLFPDNLENLTILACNRKLAWHELDAHLNKFPFISRVNIFLFGSSFQIRGFFKFCSLDWDSDTTDEWKEEVIHGMPLLSDRGILNVN
ncbi:hypothetical protein BDZ89DRAFT_1162180 [Hymenopellis radicata]|nr:hypothetical protein BDZ89DRAFT_1162180 [Hymenopellis radicata]